jgi:hypothetical protein
LVTLNVPFKCTSPMRSPNEVGRPDPGAESTW